MEKNIYDAREASFAGQFFSDPNSHLIGVNDSCSATRFFFAVDKKNVDRYRDPLLSDAVSDLDLA